MAVTVLIPTPLRPFVGGKDALQLEAQSVGELLQRLTGEHTELRLAEPNPPPVDGPRGLSTLT